MSGNKLDKQRMTTMLFVTGLPFFMLMIFGPCEIYFQNTDEFPFVLTDFILGMTVRAAGCTLVLFLIVWMAPKKFSKYLMALITGVSAAGYVQVMFLNKGLDMLGENPSGYQADEKHAVVSGLVWAVILLLTVGIGGICREWQKYYRWMTGFLFAVQLAALLFLLGPAYGTDTRVRSKEPEWYFSGKDQFRISDKKNVIVFILDYFSDYYIDEMLQEYPDGLDSLKDFTRYTNAESGYMGTFPSTAHMLTGGEMKPDQPLTQWFSDIWKQEHTVRFYKDAKEQNFKVCYNHYKDGKEKILCGNNGEEMLADYFSNVVYGSREYLVDSNLLYKVLLWMALYRFAFDDAKNYFYTQETEYKDSIVQLKDGIQHENYDFYETLQNEGLNVDVEHSYLQIHHLMGTHSNMVDEFCQKQEQTTRRQTARGCMTLVDAYLQQLKQAGVYDQSAIIITSDHGNHLGVETQPIFFVKRAGQTMAQMAVSDAPVSHCELLPTLEQMMFGSAFSGKTIDDFKEGQQRTREYWIRAYDKNLPKSTYPDSEEEVSMCNCYAVFRYTGGKEDKIRCLEQKPAEIIWMRNSFFAGSIDLEKMEYAQ